MEYIPQVPGNRPEVGQNHDLRVKRSRLLFQSLRKVGLYFGPLYFKTERLAKTVWRANRDFDQLRVGLPKLGGYIPFPRAVN